MYIYIYIHRCAHIYLSISISLSLSIYLSIYLSLSIYIYITIFLDGDRGFRFRRPEAHNTRACELAVALRAAQIYMVYSISILQTYTYGIYI